MGGGLLAGLQISLSGLEAQQAVMSVSSHNIANASNQNYSMQQVELAPNPPYSPPALGQPNVPGQFGQGVQVTSVTRQVSQFLQQQQWTNDAQVGAAGEETQALGQAQALFNEPSTTGLGQAMQQFWTAWDSLSSNPQSVAARSQVASQGQVLSETFNTLSQGISNLQASLNTSVGAMVGQINDLAAQIASYNAQIGAAVGAGQSPNDLQDQRDALIGQVANLAPVNVTWSADGEATVDIGGVNLVQGTQVMQLAGTADPSNNGFLALSWPGAAPGGEPATISGGQLGALITLRDQTLPGYLSQLNSLATGIADAVNTQYNQGAYLSSTSTTGLTPVAPSTAQYNFFVSSSATGTSLPAPTGAADISVNPDLIANPDDVAAAAATAAGPGDGSNALAISDLQNEAVVPSTSPTATASDYYSSLVGQVGTDVSGAQAMNTQQQALQTSISAQQQQVSGVSLNDQMVQMVQAQNIYAAAAKVTSTIDTMLGTLVGMV